MCEVDKAILSQVDRDLALRSIATRYEERLGANPRRAVREDRRLLAEMRPRAKPRSNSNPTQVGRQETVRALDAEDAHDCLELRSKVVSSFGVFVFDSDKTALELPHDPKLSWIG